MEDDQERDFQNQTKFTNKTEKGAVKPFGYAVTNEAPIYEEMEFQGDMPEFFFKEGGSTMSFKPEVENVFRV